MHFAARTSLSPLLRSTCRRQLGTTLTLWRLRTLATAAAPADGAAPATAMNRAEVTLKRFWKTVGIETRGDVLAVTLDTRPLKTPSGKPLLVPQSKRLVATLIATEWENQETLIKPHALPMTSLAARAVDAMEDEATRSAVRASLLRYLDTDTVCFFQDYPDPLVRLQQEHWEPLIGWVREEFDVELHTSESVMFRTQPEETKAKLDAVLKDFDQWQMAAMERAVYTTKSFIIGLALVLKRINAEQAARAAQVEVSSQIERWGEVEDSHDVDYHDVRRHLGSSACLLSTV
ncbi:ATP12-domain-containing protein [Auriscalpium vulgare]|uniref:ATP12-domain-containing protein n=1 Tax=Auriscalpium vulgare TaxID=40419 RepID=A0ACB8RX45_9AGAM|nr:ATP12-domain-containing protein [Auriscalpium vulgare]